MLEIITENYRSEELNHQNLKTRRIYTYKDSFISQQKLYNSKNTKLLPVCNLFQSLPAFAVVMDHEAVGYTLANSGLVETEEQFDYFKIDPGAVNFGQLEYLSERLQKTIMNFADDIDPDLDNGLILKCFKEVDELDTSAVFRLREVFSHATKDQKLSGLIVLEKIQKQHTIKVFSHKIYEEYIDREFLDKFADDVWLRISSIKKIFQQEILKYLTLHPEEAQKELKLPAQKILIRPLEDFFKIKGKISKGWAQPSIYKKVSKKLLNLKKYSKTSVLHQAAIENDLAAVNLLLQEGVDINARDCHGHTALVYALQQGNITISLLLLQNGAVKNSHPSTHQEPLLHLAAKLSNIEIFQRIYNFSDSLFITNQQGKTPYDIAKANKNDSILEWYYFKRNTILINKLLEKLTRILNFGMKKMGKIKNNFDEITQISFKYNFETIASITLLNPYLESLKIFIQLIRVELQERRRNGYFNDYDFYENKFKSLDSQRHPFLKEAMLIEAIAVDFEQAVTKFSKERPIFETPQCCYLAIEAIRKQIKDCLQEDYQRPLDLLYGEIIQQRNLMTKHYNSSRFRFFISNNLVTYLSEILQKYGINQEKQDRLSEYYECLKTDSNKSEITC